MAHLFVCHPTCTTCKKAREWLAARHIPYTERDIRDQHPTAEEVRDWAARAGLPPRKLFNTSGLQYRALKLSERLPDMAESEQIALLGSDGMLVKRPVMIVANGRVLFGFKESEWTAAFSDS